MSPITSIFCLNSSSFSFALHTGLFVSSGWMVMLVVILGVFSTINTSDLVARTLILNEQLRLLLHVEWCLTLRTPYTIYIDPHCFKMRNVYRHMKSCGAGVNCLLSQCAPAKLLVSHFYSCGAALSCVWSHEICVDEAILFHWKEVRADAPRLHFSEAVMMWNHPRRLLQLLTCPMSVFPAMQHAIHCAEHFKDYVFYTTTTAINQHAHPIANYAIWHGGLWDKCWFLWRSGIVHSASWLFVCTLMCRWVISWKTKARLC